MDIYKHIVYNPHMRNIAQVIQEAQEAEEAEQERLGSGFEKIKVEWVNCLKNAGKKE